MARLPKRVSEVAIVKFSFADQVRFLEVISAPVVTVEILSGLDSSPAGILTGVASVSGAEVSQKVQVGMPGVIYLLTASVTGSSGAVYKKTEYLAILSDPTSYLPSALPILSGLLPNGIVGASYSHNLNISGGYQPYAPESVAAGVAPTWMGFSVVGNQLVCAGVPNESVPITIYNMSPRISDAALNMASSAQTITITRVSISGDAPDTTLFSAYNFTYTFGGGTPPYSFATISGSLPGGIALNPATANLLSAGVMGPDGLYTYDIEVTDANNVKATVHDTINVADAGDVWFISVGTGSPTAYKGLYAGDTWTLQPTPGLGAPCHYSGSGLINVASRGGANYVYSKDYGATWTNIGGLWSSGGGRMLTTGGFLFACGGVQVIGRRVLPDGAWTNPTGSNNSRAETICLHGSRIIVASRYNSTASWTLDFGVTWTAGSGDISSGFNQAPVMETNGTRIVVVYNEAPANTLKIKYSDNSGDTWSAITFTFPTADINKAGIDVVNDGTNWVAVTSTGQVAYSPNGASWTLSVNNVGSATQMAKGIGKLMIVNSTGDIYTSVDHGVTWQLRTDPVGSTIINGVAWINP